MTVAPPPATVDSAGRSALVLGATGLVGNACLNLLLEEPRYGSVTVLSRRPLDREHPKLHVQVADFEKLPDLGPFFVVDDVYCCLGTTIRKAGSQAAFRRVDVVYPATAARLAANGGARQFLVVSSTGANPQSSVFYYRAKGEMEGMVRGVPLRAVWVLRPALLLGDRRELRLTERLAQMLLAPLSRMFVGPLRRQRPVTGSDVAAAMVTLALSDGKGGIVESESIADLARAPRGPHPSGAAAEAPSTAQEPPAGA
jgi:uncharacterized protein YbjT (DUF2867 family)